MVSSAQLPPAKPIVLAARKGLHLFSPRELWNYRELWGVFVKRDVSVRYKQTVLGILWAGIRPLVSMVVFTVIFGNILGLAKETGGLPYPIFVFSGTLIWALFSSALGNSTNSLMQNTGILKKVYFPRLLAPLASIGTPLVDFCIAFVIYFGLLLYYAYTGQGVSLSWNILLVIPLILSALLTAMSIGILLAGLTVRYRDIIHAVPFVIQTWFFLTPVIFPVKVVPRTYEWVLAYNPMGSIVEIFRCAMTGQTVSGELYLGWAMSLAMTLPLLFIALVVFNYLERRFVDVA